MSLLGIDVGTTGAKAVAFDVGGRQLAAAYEEYDLRRPEPGWAEHDATAVWHKVKRAIGRVVPGTAADPIQAIAVASMGEATVPVTADRRILGPAINPNFDLRGEIFLPGLAAGLDNARIYDINGNTLGNHYSVTSLKWIKERRPALYEQADHFLLWSSFIAFMLGAEARVDYSLANRTLLFDLDRQDWSEELLHWAGLDREKLPPTVPSGQVIGTVSASMAAELGLSAGTVLVAGTHDQCANNVGCGAVEEGLAAYGMGTFLTATPVFRGRRDTAAMLQRGLNTEHHAVPGLFVSFLYNLGGAVVKWYRDTFAATDREQARRDGREIYGQLFAEMPDGPSRLLVLPHFGPTGPPAFITDSRGVVLGLQLDTPRGEVLKAIVEGIAFYIKELVEDLPPTGIAIREYRATGGGANSAAWLQVVADIMGQPVVRPAVTEASALGAAVVAGVGCGQFGSFGEGVQAMVRLQRFFEPDPTRHARYRQRFQQYRALWPLLQDTLRDLAATGGNEGAFHGR